MIITVFGGSSPREGEIGYENARELGYALGKAGHTLLTGGYVGVMEAVSRGGRDAGAHVIGATCEEIEKSHLKRKPNPYLDEEWRYESLKDRLFALVERCDVAIAMPGGVGTLAEIAITWNEIIVAAIPVKPLILFGAAWTTIFTQFVSEMDSYISNHDRAYLYYAADIPSTLEIINSNPAK
ncbi:MAG: LOG family protein [Anaerolineaceae bacterium]